MFVVRSSGNSFKLLLTLINDVKHGKTVCPCIFVPWPFKVVKKFSVYALRIRKGW